MDQALGCWTGNWDNFQVSSIEDNLMFDEILFLSRSTFYSIGLNTNNSNWFTIFARCLDIDISHISAWVSSAFLHLFWHLASHNNQLTHFCFVLRQFAAQHWWLNPHHPTQPSGQIELYNIMCYVEIKTTPKQGFLLRICKIFYIRFHHTLDT